MSLNFSGCWAKIGRAQEHHETLQIFLDKTFATEVNRVGVRIQFDAKASEYIAYINRVPVLTQILRQIALIAGDAFQNLRASLDHAMWQLAMDYTAGTVALDPKRVRNVQFPIISDPKDWPSRKGQNLVDVDPRYHAIVERFQPYSTLEPYDGPMLGSLNEFSNADKHRLLIPIVIPPVDLDTGFDMILDLFRTKIAPMADAFVVENAPIVLGAPVLKARVPKGSIKSDVEMTSSFAPIVTFTEQRPVAVTLEVLTTTVVRVLRQFDPLP